MCKVTAVNACNKSQDKLIIPENDDGLETRVQALLAHHGPKLTQLKTLQQKMALE